MNWDDSNTCASIRRNFFLLTDKQNRHTDRQDGRRSRQRERDRERDREKMDRKQTQKQTNRETDRQTDRQINKQTGLTDWKMARENRHKQTNKRQTDR